MPSPTVSVLSAFKPLSGGFSQAIAPGGQLITLNFGAGATWWEHDKPVTAKLPPGTPVEGARWTADGKALRVGLGTLDLATRTWQPEPALASWSTRGPRGESMVRAVAWSSSAAHVAMLRAAPVRDGQPRTEVVVAAAADGSVRGRREVDGATQLIASADRVLVTAPTPVLLDLDANVVATLTSLPASVLRVREGGGMFAAVGAAGAVALVRPADGGVIATWDGHAIDAVPVANGVVAIDLEGNVRVGCLEGGTIRVVAELASGVQDAVIQLVGDQIVVAGAAADPVRVATFSSPCR